MKARDLRIGNILKKDGIVVTIDGRSIFDIWSSDISSTLAHPYEAIPLTPEWLERAGFRKYTDDGFWQIEVAENSLNLNYNESGYFEDMYDIKVTTVHQLQNLYYCLCGEELKFDKTP